MICLDVMSMSGLALGVLKFGWNREYTGLESILFPLSPVQEVFSLRCYIGSFIFPRHHSVVALRER